MSNAMTRGQIESEIATAVADASQDSLANTNLTTVGNGTITATAAVDGVVTRSGPSTAFTDTLGITSAIITAYGVVVGTPAWILRIINNTAYTQTIAAGDGSTTLSGMTTVPPFSTGNFLFTIVGGATVTVNGLFASPNSGKPPVQSQGTLVTVGAGTVLSATIIGGLLLRTGPTGAFTDTTDTGTTLAAAIPNIRVGQSFEWTYQNSTPFVATLAGGTGVASAATFATVGPGCWATFLFTYSAANTFTVVQKSGGDNWIGLPSTSYSTGTTTTTFTAAQMTGGKTTIYTSTAATPGSIATATAAAMFAAIQGAYVGLKWTFRVINDVATNSLTLTADASVTLSGKTTYVATPFGSLDFEMTFTSPTAATMKYIGGGQSTTV
jgi:hypothetical protein